MKLRVHGASDVGLIREHNEDAFLIDEAHHFFAVADGLGGLPGGEVASETAITVLREQVTAGGPQGAADLGGLVEAAHKAVRTAGRQFSAEGIGTTLTAVHVAEGRARFVHVGDSFAFLLRAGLCRPITREHNVENERGDAVDLASLPHNYRYALTRVVGTYEPVQPEFFEEALQPGDWLILATDGLTDLLEPADIATFCARYPEPAACVPALIAEAVERRGHDNITVVAIVVDEL